MANSRDAKYLRTHRVHDVDELLRQWRRAVRGTPFRLNKVGEQDGFPLICVQNRVQASGGLYVSTGIHGDEPASPWGLLDWFEHSGYEGLDQFPIVLFPCLNPWGIVNNRRSDSKDRDLNRLFDRARLTPIRQVLAAVKEKQFQVACCLHEDYDAQGAYLYDLNKLGSSDSARGILQRVANAHMPIDKRNTIEGHRTNAGVVFRKRLDMDKIPGMPEAVYLFLQGHAERTLTFETPSEFCLVDRIQAHRRFLHQVCRTLLRVR